MALAKNVIENIATNNVTDIIATSSKRSLKTLLKKIMADIFLYIVDLLNILGELSLKKKTLLWESSALRANIHY